MGNPSPPSPCNTAVVCYHGSPPAAGTVSHCHLSLKSFASLAAAGQEPNTLPMIPKGSEGSSLQGTGISCQCRRSCPALLKPAHQRGSRAHEQGGREAKVSNTPPVSSLFIGSSTCCTYKPKGCPLAPALGHACPRGCGEKGENIVFPPSPTSVTAAPFTLAVGSGSSAPTGLLATGAGSFPTDASGPMALVEQFGTPLRPHPLALRTPGSCPCAPRPGHHPGSAGPEEESTRQLQVLLASPQLRRVTSS